MRTAALGAGNYQKFGVTFPALHSMNKPRQIRRSCCGVNFLLQVGCAAISGTCASGLPLAAHGGSGRQTRKLLTVSSRPLEAAAVTVQATVQLRADRITGNDQQVDQKAARADLGN